VISRDLSRASAHRRLGAWNFSVPYVTQLHNHGVSARTPGANGVLWVGRNHPMEGTNAMKATPKQDPALALLKPAKPIRQPSRPLLSPKNGQPFAVQVATPLQRNMAAVPAALGTAAESPQLSRRKSSVEIPAAQRRESGEAAQSAPSLPVDGSLPEAPIITQRPSPTSRAALPPPKPPRAVDLLETHDIAKMLLSLSTLAREDQPVNRVRQLEAALTARIRLDPTSGADLVEQLKNTSAKTLDEQPEIKEVLLRQLEQRVPALGAKHLAELRKALSVIGGTLAAKLSRLAFNTLVTHIRELASEEKVTAARQRLGAGLQPVAPLLTENDVEALELLQKDFKDLSLEDKGTLTSAIRGGMKGLEGSILAGMVGGVMTKSLKDASAAFELAGRAHSAVLDLSNPDRPVYGPQKRSAMNNLIKRCTTAELGQLQFVYQKNDNSVRDAARVGLRAAAMSSLIDKPDAKTQQAMSIARFWELAKLGLLPSPGARFPELFGPEVPLVGTEATLKNAWRSGEPPGELLDWLQLLSISQEIEGQAKISKKELGQYATKLDDIMNSRKFSGGGHGFHSLLPDVELLAKLPEAQRAAALSALIRPACSEAQERIGIAVYRQKRAENASNLPRPPQNKEAVAEQRKQEQDAQLARYEATRRVNELKAAEAAPKVADAAKDEQPLA